MWRWDQGRLLYFQFDVLKSIATTLAKFDGVKITDCESLFRSNLMTETGMPFAPDHYTVLRNYKRVFECAFLATVSNKHLIISDFCRELVNPSGKFANADDFLLSYINRFRFPFPAFDGYNDTEERIYPFCAVIKYLISLFQKGELAVITLDEIFDVIIANKCTGFEDLSFYERLSPKVYNPSNTEKRQLREMIIFISQLSVLKVYGGKLWLDISNPTAINELMEKFLTPLGTVPKVDRLDEFVEMTKITGGIVLPTIEVFTSDNLDLEFIEGKRKLNISESREARFYGSIFVRKIKDLYAICAIWMFLKNIHGLNIC